jgi:pimeloyl-ACP methyl ester carboxylesterase
MADKWLVFGGWGMDAGLLRPLFGDSSIYVDVNPLMPSLLNGATLRPDWGCIVEREYAREFKATGRIAGWSTGAIVACSLAKRVRTSKMVLLSATPSFCRREGFRFGWKPGVLVAMRERLAVPHNTVLGDFVAAAGLPPDYAGRAVYSADTLIAGLVFLEQACLLNIASTVSCPSFVLHGNRDEIVPHQAGAALARSMGAQFRLVDGGHAFFAGWGRGKIDRLLDDSLRGRYVL